MKYIVTVTEAGKQEIFIFPRAVHHDCMAEMLSRIKNQSGGQWQRVHRRPVSAGFTDGVKCYGRSETLNLDSRGRLDEMLIGDTP